jgi:iron(III) transport system permease protein
MRNSVLVAAATCAVLALVTAFVLWPVSLVFHAAWQGLDDREPGLTLAPQRVPLAIETAKLVMLVLAIALPAGVMCAAALFRTDLPLNWLWGTLILLPALLPIDLQATAWLATLGPQGLARSLGLSLELKGVLGAAWVHGMASIPWVVAIVGPALCTVEAELEEDGLLLVGAARTLWHVTLRRSAAALVAAGLIVAVQTAGEMAVTDLLQVRTYAETVYTEFALASRVGPATATAAPGIIVWLCLILVAGTLLVRSVPPNAQALFARRPVFRLGRARWFVLAGCIFVACATWGIPMSSLVWRAGLDFPRVQVDRLASPAKATSKAASVTEESKVPRTADRTLQPHWQPSALVRNIGASARSAADQLTLSLIVAAITATVTVPLAWLLVAFAQAGRWSGWMIGGIVALLFALPGPVVGIALELAVGRPFIWWGSDAATVGGRLALWLDNVALSPAILVWLHTIRALPFALAMLWPARRLVNRRLLETAAIDGAGTWARFRFVELPACSAAIIAATLVSAVLSIGELAGSVIVQPPGLQPLSVRIFTLAHFGLENHLDFL